MVWAKVFEIPPGMGNPFELQEMWRAQMKFDEERSVEQVIADQNARHAQASAAPRKGGRGAAPARPRGFTSSQMKAAEQLKERAAAARAAKVG